ncbi:GPI ethanolamine phosphate transferase 3-like [Pollicipes pollicipes]|uniref:GPI ethanolamine phosphate transferase 3-like n=1 Tax=Pollicipes pollicipes TaxID=41117 RepID=UPI001885879D|nr:GPI ethanolamine phosphate transferase 3-like [Pollicipes pollicipes]
MRHGTATLPVLVYVFFVLAVGLYVFLSGFLLRRVALQERQTCPVGGTEPCAVARTYNRTILLVVDALRYDFLVFNESLPAAAAAPYQNKMPAVHALLTGRPEHVARYRFVADPPTTTMQRLKGLTTGSLPTFVDVGDNFASYVVTEDTWLWQLRAAGGRAVFAGDDTWLQLFPTAFERAAPFPSFDIRDLDTVDSGVERQLGRELARHDWTMFIGHMLGVDHCGHTFGPDHPQMARKLAQVDALVRNITHQLDNDTILFVLGDHGMTRTGDHGGDSAAELDAGLLVVSGRPLPAAPRPAAIPQVDLVPTLSALLGLPIPFSNLGTVRAELLFVLLVHGTAFFSNSFTVCEDAVSGFLATSMFAVQLLPAGGGGDSPGGAARLLPRLAAAVAGSVLLRIGRAGFACREEQWWCELGVAHRPLASLQDGAERNGRLAVAAASLVAVLFAHRAFLRHCGNLNGFSATELVARWCGWLSAAGLLGSWALQAIHPSSAALLTLLVLLWRPLLVLVQPELAGGRLVARVFRRLRHQLSGAASELRVYGLGSAVSAALLTALLACWTPLVLLLGDGRAPAAALGLALMALAAAVVGFDGTAGSDWAAAVLWAELASFQFFSTGHQATFPSIQWDAAVAGLHMMPTGLLLPGLCVLLATFASELVAAAALPLLLCAPHLVQAVRERGVSWRGELNLLLDPNGTARRLLALNVLYLTAKAVKLLMCCLAAAVLRRHLMVWKIFAPKVLFEAVSFLVAGLGVIGSHALVLRILRHAGSWLEQLAHKEIL